jgi:hypothetical protein
VVVFSCSGLPTGASCKVASSSVTRDGTNVASAQGVVNTAKGSVLPVWPQSRIKEKVIPWCGTVTGTSRNLSHALYRPAHGELSPSKNSTTFLRERCLPATDRPLLAFNVRARLLDASLDQLGFHFGLLPGKKSDFGFKCPVAR